jgi:hypothetical protein
MIGQRTAFVVPPHRVFGATLQAVRIAHHCARHLALNERYRLCPLRNETEALVQFVREPGRVIAFHDRIPNDLLNVLPVLGGNRSINATFSANIN